MAPGKGRKVMPKGTRLDPRSEILDPGSGHRKCRNFTKLSKKRRNRAKSTESGSKPWIWPDLVKKSCFHDETVNSGVRRVEKCKKTRFHGFTGTMAPFGPVFPQGVGLFEFYGPKSPKTPRRGPKPVLIIINWGTTGQKGALVPQAY